MANQRLRHIFVVDDEKIIAETLTTILRKSGFSARSFFNPLDALAAAAVEMPDLLISDVMMPQLSGIDLAIRITQLCPSCKVLLFSGQAQTADLLHEARRLGHDFSLLPKPVHPSDLLKHIRKQENVFVGGESVIQ